MRVYSWGFIYNGISSDKMGVMLCTFDKSGFDTTSAGEKIELSTQKLTSKDRWYHYSSTFHESLNFTLHIAKVDKTQMDRHEIAEYSRWLQRRDGFHKFQFIGNDFAGIEFYATTTEMNELAVGNVTYGLEIKMTTDASYGLAAKASKTIHLTGENTYTYMNQSDDYGYLYPDVKVTLHASGDFSLTNQFDQRQTVIKNCISDEIITMNGDLRSIKSTNPNDLEDRFNWKWFRFCRQDYSNQNVISSSLPCTIEFTYQNIRKVGVS